MLHPGLAKEWHPTRNGNLTPEQVTPRNNRKVWWRCSRGHEWDAKIQSRTRGTGCPTDTGNAGNAENKKNLARDCY
ncbi:MAG: zinc-ribbon domain-containing protein [Candidatus Bathyarchaeota archaeon]|nr:zinc-ribbon domain-containing protein [Candidatus Bathyarchaeota archaeon]